jgi:putative restriction endonuclease
LAKHFGHVAGHPVGTTYANRTELRAIHPPPMGGIHGNASEGADSIVVSGGYVDDQDLGDVIIYTGAGGNDPQTKRQIADQSVDQSGNAGMITSRVHGYPVRVSRGAYPGSVHAPVSGFRYDGLFAVTDHAVKIGVDGFKIIQFRLEKLPDASPEVGPAPTADAPSYATTTVTRRIRDSKQSQAVKAWHNGECQVCGAVTWIDGGRRYSEGAHIRPLGAPHHGPDTTGNILCLCPTHHAQLDFGGLRIEPDLSVVERVTGAVIGTLRIKPTHMIDSAMLGYRRAMHD